MKLCIALDLPSKEENLNLAKSISGLSDDIWLKVGFRSYIRDGKEFVNELQNLGFKIFLDLKLYDIPNTMADASEEIAKMGVDMFNIHASAGRVAMQTIMQRLSKFEKRPLVLAVTALTSFDEKTFEEIYETPIAQKAQEFAKMSYEEGLDGVVCSAYESLDIKDITNDNFITLTPGIRPFNEDSGDQKRVADINFAKNAKVDFIVVGRPIYKASNPKEVVKKILALI
ncbi:MAG: orotidine-5'-phosphate decarboxylase [Nautilia sp.]|nr:MAG: orotidine-5'-phosphate decarboxylase [Nautilia sp.]